MTIATFTFAFLCLAVGVSLGFFGGYRRALGKWTADVRKLEGAVEEKAKALKSAEVDMQIVRALRSGEIGVDDLHDVGFESVRQEATGALAPKQDGDPMPFVKLPYKRNLGTIKGMIPGDEMWIAMGAIRHRKDGTPTLWNGFASEDIPAAYNYALLYSLYEDLDDAPRRTDALSECRPRVLHYHSVRLFVHRG